MRLDSVRELKLSLPVHLERTFAVRARAMGATSAAVANAASRRRTASGYFLGVSAKGKKGFCLAVRLQDRALEKSALVDEISEKAKGEVDVRYVGQIRARPAVARAKAQAAVWYRSKNRPLLVGSSVGYLASGYITAGTLGCFVRKTSSTALYILSNNHVLADENRYKKNKPIFQPGTLDGGNTTTDRVAKLSAFVKLHAVGTNFVDCAIAKLDAGMAADVSKLTGIGTLAGVRSQDVGIGDLVHKVGRTTGVRHGTVTAVELDGVTVRYDMGVLTFDNQVEIEGSGTKSFSDAGDSGSLIVDAEIKAAALLFAGGDHGGSNGQGLTYGNPIRAVLAALHIQIAH